MTPERVSIFAMAVRSYSIDAPFDLTRTLAPLSRGPYDPIRSAAGVRGATRTRDGPAAVTLAQGETTLRAEAFGPGAERLLAGIPALLALDDEPPPIPTGHRVVAELARRYPGVRIPRTTAVLESLIPAILEQKVTGTEAHRAFAGLIREHGEPAPGPPEWRLRLPPAPGDPRPASLLRLPPVRDRAPARRAHPAGRRPGRMVRGRRRPAVRRGLRAPAGRAGDRPMDGRGDRRPGAGRSGRGQRRRLPPAEPRRVRPRPRDPRRRRADARAPRALSRPAAASSGSSS